MTNAEKVRKIWEYQLNYYVHELTCGEKDCGCALVPREVDDKVILFCSQPSCDYQQKFIPEFVLNAILNDRPILELDYLIRRANLFIDCLNQEELTLVEELIDEASENPERVCFICKICSKDKANINKAIGDVSVCRHHARYLINRERKE